MRAFLIDPFTKTITEVTYNGHYTHIYELIKADPFTVVELDPVTRDAIYLDDEGLYREDQKFFLLRDYLQPLGGYGLVLGTDASGDSRPAKITLDALRERITWAPDGMTCIGFEEIPEGTYQDTPLGRLPVVGHRPVFTVLTGDPKPQGHGDPEQGRKNDDGTA